MSKAVDAGVEVDEPRSRVCPAVETILEGPAPQVVVVPPASMSAQVICIVLETGVPLFARMADPGAPTISFPVAAALNGAKLFGMEKSIELISAATACGRVVWKDYHDTFALIVASRDDDLSDFHLIKFLDTVFQAMVMITGLDTLLDVSNREKLKKEVKKGYPLIDWILEGLGTMEGKMAYLGDLAQCPDRMCTHESIGPQVDYIQNFSDRVGCPYAALSCQQMIIGATKKWWTINPVENFLLIALSHLAKEIISEQLVYLPVSGPRVPFRLVVIKVRGIRISFLCGKNEKSSLLHKEARRMKKHPPSFFEDIETDRSTCRIAKRFFDKTENLTAFMFVNVVAERCGVYVLKDESDETKYTTRFDTLRIFYRHVVDTIFPWRGVIKGKGDGKENDAPKEVRVLETYMRSDYMMCHATRSAQLQVYAIYEDENDMGNIRVWSRGLFCEVMHDKNF